MTLTWQQAEQLRGRRRLIPAAAQLGLFDRRRSPNRERSIRRRRLIAASGPLPPHLACLFTVSQQAVLGVVADVCRDHGGRCVEFIDAIAARAGCSRTTVKNALRLARKLGLVLVTERRISGTRNDSNVVRVISPEWLAWLAHHRRRRGNTADKKVPSTGTGLEKEVSREGNSQKLCQSG